MKKSFYVKKRAEFKKNSAPLSKRASLILLGVVVISGFAISLVGVGSSKGVTASSNPSLIQVTQKRYKATRAIVVDKQTGQLRMPTKQEIDESVLSLATLAKRSDEGLKQTATANGAVAVDLDGGFGGVVLARPNGDGTWETKCVFTFEEGAEFLGLVEDNSAK